MRNPDQSKTDTEAMTDTPEESDVRGWTTEPVGNDATMKEHSHKEYEARDTAPPPDPGPGKGQPPPEGVGESTGRRGEDVHRTDGTDVVDKGENRIGRPIGGSDPENIGIDGQTPISEDMPNLQHP